MLNPRLKEYMSKGYAKIGDIGFKLCINLRKGKDHLPSSRARWEQGIKMLRILKVLFKKVRFDETTGAITLYRITESEVNKLLDCLIELGELDNLPIFPGTLPNVKPIVLTAGEQGEPGIAGTDGTNANIVVEPGPTEDEITVTPVVVGPVTHYKIDFTAYVIQQLTANIQGGRIKEIGDVVSFTIQLSSTKGSRLIVTLICSNNAGVNTTLQGLVSLPSLNGLSQPVLLSVAVSNVGTDNSYTFELYDGKNTVMAQDAISFYYPYLYGVTDNPSGFDPYVSFTKYIGPKANNVFILNGTNKYFWIGYPASYGTLTSIKDNNGFEKIADFTLVVLSVNSTGLTNNWAGVAFKFYRTILKTTIPSAPYTIAF